jgi:hypothetical protein
VTWGISRIDYVVSVLAAWQCCGVNHTAQQGFAVAKDESLRVARRSGVVHRIYAHLVEANQ